MSNTGQPQPGQNQAQPQQASEQAEQAPKKKKGFFGKIVGVFKGDDNDKSPPASEPSQPGR